MENSEDRREMLSDDDGWTFALLQNDDLKHAISLKNTFIKNPISSSACERDVTFSVFLNGHQNLYRVTTKYSVVLQILLEVSRINWF